MPDALSEEFHLKWFLLTHRGFGLGILADLVAFQVKVIHCKTFRVPEKFSP